MKKIVLLSLVVAVTACTQKTITRSVNGHEWVDLGLSVKWATCNVGATSPEEYGDYFAWGETTTKATYTMDNTLTSGKEMDDIAGDSLYDAARANWGGTWRLPTKDEIDELISNCQHEWIMVNGIKGYKVTGPNGNSIFLPAAGYRFGSSHDSARVYGYCWSATPYSDSAMDGAYELCFASGKFGWLRGYRGFGLPVRAVTE